jgi:hypothetical protein
MKGERSLIAFVEMSSFTKSRVGVLSDDELDRVQEELQVNPEAGDVIQGTSGVRKLRVARAGKGKRGGGRVLYYYFDERETVFLLYAYAKNQQEDVSPAEKRLWRKIVDHILGS